ncbi:hypothetical protein MTO96_035072 [Rhipicephalus appendiculatus]
MAFAAPPPKAHCFTISAPEGSTVDDVIDALEAVTGPACIRSLQHMGGVKYGTAAVNDSAASKLKSRAAILLNGVSVPLISVGPEIVHVSVFRVPLWAGDAALAAALSAYDNVQVHEPVFKGRPGVGTGIRVARVEMKKPIPNFLSVQGFTVMCDYRGVQKEEQAPARESDSETVTSNVCFQADSEELEELLPPSEKASSDLRTRNETADSSSETPDDHDTSKPAAPASFSSGDHTGSREDPRGSTDGSDAPRSSMGRGTRAAGGSEATSSRPDFTQSIATSSRVSKFSAQARKMNLSNPLYKITGPVAGASAGDCPMDIERQVAKRVHPSSTDSEGSEGGVSKPHKLPNALTQSERIFP